MSDYYNLATHALSIHDQLPTCTLNYNYTARYFAIPFLVLHVNFNLLLHNKLHLVSFHFQIFYRKVRNLQIGVNKLVGKVSINLLCHAKIITSSKVSRLRNQHSYQSAF